MGRGFHNWKNLFKKPTLADWTILFMLIMVFFIVWAYKHDIALCREYIKKQEANFVPLVPNQTYKEIKVNFTNIIKEENLSGESGEG